MEKILNGVPKGILKDVDKIIDEALDVKGIGERPHYQHERACNRLNKCALTSFDASDMLDKIYKQIETNWKGRPYQKDPSRENWRFEAQPKIRLYNKSPEIRLQKEIIRMRHNVAWGGAKNWANHVPTASGLWNGKYNKHNAIDLVHLVPGENQCDEVEFIELNVDTKSGHPVYASIEVLLYGLLYIFSRRHLKDLKYDVTKQPLLQAKTIHLVVLAPSNYYARYKFEWLEGKITEGLARFIQQSEGYKMDFQFQAFPWKFDLGQSIDEVDIMEALEERIKGARTIWHEEGNRLEQEAGGVLAVPRSFHHAEVRAKGGKA